jgi:hypothetical protein
MTGNLVADMTARYCAEPDDPYSAIRGSKADPRPDLPMSERCLSGNMCAVRRILCSARIASFEDGPIQLLTAPYFAKS